MPRFNRKKNRNVQEWKRDAVNIKARGVPRAMVVKLPYYEEVEELTCIGDSETLRVFRLNSLFDPYLTGGGVFPYGFYPLYQIYQEYMVLTATAVVEIQSIDVGYGSVIMLFSDSPTQSKAVPELINNVGVQNRTFNSPVAGNTNIVRMKRKFHLPDWLGRDLDPSKDSAAYTASPSQGAYLQIIIANENSATALITFRVKILYTARMFNVVELEYNE